METHTHSTCKKEIDSRRVGADAVEDREDTHSPQQPEQAHNTYRQSGGREGQHFHHKLLPSHNFITYSMTPGLLYMLLKGPCW